MIHLHHIHDAVVDSPPFTVDAADEAKVCPDCFANLTERHGQEFADGFTTGLLTHKWLYPQLDPLELQLILSAMRVAAEMSDVGLTVNWQGITARLQIAALRQTRRGGEGV